MFWSFLLGTIFGLLAAFIFCAKYVITLTNNKWEKAAIEVGFGKYNSKTSKFEWTKE